jgi:predicted pyridoxine 5'-phosphate oxidase superfamily flavin-nucleotide-binding protein
MGKVHEHIDDKLRAFIERQHVCFVATAPNDPHGRVNVSPKGIGGTFAVLDGHTVAYLDITASGAETIAHLRENGRITVMFCAFEGPPNTVRLHGKGRFVTLYDDEFAGLLEHFTETRGARAVIVVDVTRVSDSCGYGVPLMEYAGERDLLPQHMERKGDEGLREYRRAKNATSIDGLPAFDYDPEPAPTAEPDKQPSKQPGREPDTSRDVQPTR